MSNNLKDALKVVTAIFLVFYAAAFAWVWADRDYKSDFWPNFFMYSGIVVLVVLIVAWAIAWNSNKRK